MLTAWWDRRSDPDRIELYTRWTFYSFAIAEVMVGLTMAKVVDPLWGISLVCLLIVSHAMVMALASRQTLDWMLDRREKPLPAMRANAGLAAGIVALLLALHATDRTEDAAGVATLVTIVLAVTITAATLNMRFRDICSLVLVVALTVALLAAAAGCTSGEVLMFGLMTAWVSAFAAFAGRVSGWVLATVMELDEARHAQARLAVAEERLRFGRDLHDVLGRNLSVIALKSELAVQLAQRPGGRTSSLDQMVEVQRIARESQSELREVVRGYRDTSLLNELAGARGVLGAAGIDCEIDAEPDAELPESVRTALGWVVREGATNVLRHSDATRCVIRLSLTAQSGTAVLTMTNDGVRDAQAAQRLKGAGTGSAGLVGLRERLGALHGTLSTPDPADSVGDDAGGGGELPLAERVFVLKAEVPLDPKVDAR